MTEVRCGCMFLKGWQISNPLPEQASLKAKVKISILQSVHLESKSICFQLCGYMKTVGDPFLDSGSTDSES